MRVETKSNGSNEPSEGLYVRIHGRVQGVGFRPAAYRLARRLGLGGWVRNEASGAELLLVGNPEVCEAFLSALPHELPSVATIERMERGGAPPDVPSVGADGFVILSSREAKTEMRTAGVLPDLAMCPDCLRELRDRRDRRYGYPFINCTHCGPRYSILLRLPYDRANTTMDAFQMCEECKEEYHSPESRRFHAQPNACPHCGPQLEWVEEGAGRRAHRQREDALTAAVTALRAGKLVAVKGIGGFHLMGDARDAEVIRRLRRRKRRDAKPFAVLFPSLTTLEGICGISEEERAALCSPAAPIVLLDRRRTPSAAAAEGNGIPLAYEELAPGLPWMGAFLPYSPLHQLLLEAVGFPLVATSGNLTDEPICIDNEEAQARLRGIADAFLLHNRPIARPMEDSVMAWEGGMPIYLRRARGLAPYAIAMPGLPDGALGVGGQLKNTLALCTDGTALMSPHIGDLEHEPALRLWEQTRKELLALRGVKEPALWAADAHPGYAATQASAPLARAGGRPWIRVQHHHAHVAACMAENGLAGPVLGIAWDGTGWGGDGTIWGGEFLRCETPSCVRRVAALRTFPLVGGDAAAREPRRSALGVLTEVASSLVPPGFSAEEADILRAQMRAGIQVVRTSSAGRLFDACASLLGLCQIRRYEGEAAMLLEAAAANVLDAKEDDSNAVFTGEGSAMDLPEPYPFGLDGETLDWAPMWRALEHGDDSIPLAAARIHVTFASMMLAVAQREGLQTICLSGGCFQNRHLLRLAIYYLSGAGCTVYAHRQLPPNDASLSLGQLAALSPADFVC